MHHCADNIFYIIQITPFVNIAYELCVTENGTNILPFFMNYEETIKKPCDEILEYSVV